MGTRGEPGRGCRGWRGRALVLALMAGLLATRASDVRAVVPVSIEIKDSRYVPSTVTVAAGTTVRWTNRDEETHTVTSTAGQFGSTGLDLDETYTHTFSAPGTYAYGCDLHPFMGGTIVVR